MQALTLQDRKPTLVDDLSVPDPPPGEALIRPTRMGVCATDLELCKGYMGFTGVLGHEFVGVVEAVGAKADSDWVGKRVVGQINCVCGKCDMCKAGLREHCRDRTVLGILNRDGCFAERFILPVENLLEVPDGIDDDRAVFTEPLAAAYQVLRQLTIEGRPYITVLGDGRLGLQCAQVMSQLNATVRCVGKHPRKLGLCEKWGIKHRLLADVGLRNDQDIVVDCTGSPTGLPTALGMVRPRGTIVLKTTVAPQDTQAPGREAAGGSALNSSDLAPLVINEITLLGSRCGPFDVALDALGAEKVDVLSLITKRMKLAEGPRLIQAADHADTIKVLIEP